MSSIASLRLGHVRYAEGRAPVVWGALRFDRSAFVAQVIDDAGNIGAALSWCRITDGDAYNRAAIGTLKEAVVDVAGQSRHELGSRCQQAATRSGFGPAASLVELALLDVEARRLGVPCHRLLGTRRLSVPVYAISTEEFSFGEHAQYVDLARRFVREGFGAAKLHLTGNARRDIAVCEAVRADVGPDVALMLDPAGRYDRASALQVGRMLDVMGFVRFEDPLPPLDFAGFRWLAQRLDVPIAGNDPMLWSARDCLEVARDGVIGCLRIDPARAGVAAIQKAAAITSAHGVEIDFSALAPAGGVEACLHFALASDTARWFEKHFAEGVDEVPGITSGIEIANGRATAADRPGWGTIIDWPELDRYCTWVA
jgi:L-alanine-DL-glutamate epimerase-like enolase superfamily enzyme